MRGFICLQVEKKTYMLSELEKKNYFFVRRLAFQCMHSVIICYYISIVAKLVVYLVEIFDYENLAYCVTLLDYTS